ncbi:hypothetical protein [Clavibacter michiganensis]|uniref:hypothetical protein n=1 Tax=Clavibacter michiganensis TaxID=28447 RepID=UPI001FF5AC3A|nr:hypothetical protein [Clavibacter michiganensis]MDO4030231.1 hypothetical protein [Clavibacter michiganensis]MDO4045694.1 hypothetical protein [Clavibacter michiganensis]MDO4054757.1 hypothetical protein [Clavibacter michiganensis]MDO4058126.1 hypothetical protein [Clavibacter michiganensis]UOW05333.1 hypothetical protein MU580_15920 [Clavibacter michiganensis subsp. michiganensis]
MTRKRLLIASGVIAVVAVAVAIAMIAAHLPKHGEGSASASTSAPAPITSPEPTTADQAFRVADLFCRPDATKDTWQRELSPYLTPAAWQLYSTVTPANVPCAGVQDDGAAVGDQQTDTDQAFQFTASTGGPITITLHRDTRHAPWLVSYINLGS